MIYEVYKMMGFWFNNAIKKSTCFNCKRKIYKHEARCEFENGALPSIGQTAYRFLCLECAEKELKERMKTLRKVKAHQRKHQKDITTEKVLEGI